MMSARAHRRFGATPLWLGLLLLIVSAVHADAAPPGPRWWCPLSSSVEPHALPGGILQEFARHAHDVPHPMIHVHTEGTLPHRGILDESQRAEQDWTIALRAAVTWRRTGNAEALRQVERYLLAWSTLYQPDFNPIDETPLDQFFSAYLLTHDALTATTRQRAEQLIRRLGEGYIQRAEQSHGPTDINHQNNWQSHRIKLIATAAAALGDRPMLASAHRLFLAQIAVNIHADGSTLDFAQRDALHYVVYDLQPLVQAALAASAYDGNAHWLQERSATGSSVERALNWLAPYAEGRRTHQEFVHTREPFDIARRQAGLQEYGGRWDRHKSAALYQYAAVLLPKYRSLAMQLGPAPIELATCVTSNHPHFQH